MTAIPPTSPAFGGRQTTWRGRYTNLADRAFAFGITISETRSSGSSSTTILEADELLLGT